MHALLVLSSVLLVVLVGGTALGLLRRLDSWTHRRQAYVAVLAAPLLALGVSLGGLHHFLGQTCLLHTLSWDFVGGVALPVGLAIVAGGALALGGARLAALHLAFCRERTPAGPELQRVVDELATRMSVRRPRVLLWETRQPAALTLGIRQPCILISRGLAESLDAMELESVLAHELAHVLRADYLVTVVATVLRDAFFYLPTSLAAYRGFQCERELACDDLAVATTGRPLALASALAKVWQHDLTQTGVPALALTGADHAFEQRIERLLAVPGHKRSGPRPGPIVGLGVQSLLGLGALLAVNGIAMLVPMGCGPGFLL